MRFLTFRDVWPLPVILKADQLSLLPPAAPTGAGERVITSEPWLYSCKGCKAPHHVTYNTVQLADGKHTRLVDNHGHEHFVKPTHRACPTCGKPMKGQPIRGTYNPKVKCDDRCYYARGPVCECSCGGANHARGSGGIFV